MNKRVAHFYLRTPYDYYFFEINKKAYEFMYGLILGSKIKLSVKKEKNLYLLFLDEIKMSKYDKKISNMTETDLANIFKEVCIIRNELFERLFNLESSEELSIKYTGYKYLILSYIKKKSMQEYNNYILHHNFKIHHYWLSFDVIKKKMKEAELQIYDVKEKDLNLKDYFEQTKKVCMKPFTQNNFFYLFTLVKEEEDYFILFNYKKEVV